MISTIKTSIFLLYLSRFRFLISNSILQLLSTSCLQYLIISDNIIKFQFLFNQLIKSLVIKYSLSSYLLNRIR